MIDRRQRSWRITLTSAVLFVKVLSIIYRLWYNRTGVVLIDRLTEAELTKLHNATLEILERSGVRLLEESAVAVLQKAGCTVIDQNLVHIPAKLVERSLTTVPKELTLYNQEGTPAIQLAGRSAYYGNGSDLLYIIDHRTTERRKALREDVRDMLIIMEALPHMDFVMSGFLPSDIPVEQTQRFQMKLMLEFTKKPIVYVTTDLQNTKWCVEMAEVIAGNGDNLRQKPFAANYINISNPLKHNPESLRKLMWLSEKGLPFIYRPALVTRGVSTPITPAGFLVVNNAAALIGLVLSQLIREGAPFIRCSCSGGTFDMHTMVGMHAAPEVRGFNEDLAQYYLLPRFGIGGLTGAKTVDQQAAFESALTLMASAYSGAGLIHDVGYMDNGTTGALDQLIICHEMISWIKQCMNGIIINDETLALDVIDCVVKEDRNFIETEHTFQHFKEDYYPELTDRDIYAAWRREGSLTLRDRACEKVEQILAEKRESLIPQSVSSALNDILTRDT